MRLCVLGVLCGVLLTACGQKGPPLAPLVYLPTSVGGLVVKRLGSDVVLQFTIPTANTDSTSPADLDRVEVYAHTSPLPAPADYVRYGTLIKTLQVTRPDPPSQPAPQIASARQAPPSPEMVEQGQVTRVSETLIEAHKEPGPLPFERALSTVPVVEVVETPGTVNLPLPIVRYYVIVGVSRSRNRRGAFAGPIGVPLIDPPVAPDGVDASYTQDAISVAWNRAPGDKAPAVVAESPILETPGTVDTSETTETPDTIDTPGTAWPPEGIDTSDTPATVAPATVAPATVAPAKVAAAPAKVAAAAVPRFGYNVYDATTVGETMSVQPLNPAMLIMPAFSDARVEFGTERCYIVRAVSMAGPVALESEATSPVCVKPVDTFPPAAPRTLHSLSSENGVSLIWEPNTENDLAGYLVLRGDAAGEKLSPLTPSPIRETTFRDANVQSGRSYFYEVVAVDTATPSNVSEPSNRVEEVIR